MGVINVVVLGCTEILTTAALGDVNGDGEIDIVTPTQEFDDNPSAPETPVPHQQQPRDAKLPIRLVCLRAFGR